MRKILLVFTLFLPQFAWSQTHVQPEGEKLLIGLVVLLVLLLAVWYFSKRNSKAGGAKRNSWRRKRKRIEIELSKDRLVRPKVLTLTVRNTGNRYVDLEAPVLVFRKLWSFRKFKLKRYQNKDIYPVYLDAGKTFTITIELARFFEHDKKLKRFYWGRILMQDVDGKQFKTKHVSLRKSLYT